MNSKNNSRESRGLLYMKVDDHVCIAAVRLFNSSRQFHSNDKLYLSVGYLKFILLKIDLTAKVDNYSIGIFFH